jgi:hypothetical protein
MSILLEADEIIHGERVKTYGPASTTFKDVAIAFNAITGESLSGSDVALLQILFKLKRNEYSPKNPDHLTDGAGYIGIMHDIQESENEKQIK